MDEQRTVRILKKVLITGTGSGFGKIMTKHLAEQGFYVIATMRKKSGLDDWLDMNQPFAKNIEVHQMDITNREEVIAVYETMKEKFGRLDVLINNAGYSQGGFLEDLTMAEWEEQFQTNFFGSVLVTKTFLPLLRNANQGKIINISSISGYFGFPGLAPYVSSKFAIEGFSESLRLELKREKIWVSLVQPASYKTEIWEKGLNRITVGDEWTDFQRSIYHRAKQSGKQGHDPMEVVRVVLKIIENPRPKLRYPVGRGARIARMLKTFLPWKIIETAVLKKLG